MSTRTIHAVVFTALLIGTAVWAWPAEDSVPGLHGPVLGYVLDSSMQAIRPINGIPGSSLLGPPLLLPFSVASAAFSPRGDFAVVVSASDDRTALVLRNLGAATGIAVIEGAVSGADRIYLNADASAGALLASGVNQLQVLHGLPGAPTADPPIDLSSIPGTITTLVINRAGSKILIGASANYGALYLADTDLQIQPRLIGNFGSPTALALLHRDQDVIVADAALNQLSLIHNFDGMPEEYLLAGESGGIAAPSGLQISSDERRIYIANEASRTLDIWDFEKQSIVASLPLDAGPTRLTPLQGSSTFVLNDAGDRPLLLLDVTTTPAVYFVPAGRDR